jgi:hypothetical protein
MRRRRNSLQVSTFPFLAVLLCTMGSLILLLLIIDRRARVVAAIKARNALEQISRADAQAEEARHAEWERRRRLLHEELANQDQAIMTQLSSAQSEEMRLTTALQQEGLGTQALAQQLRTQQEQIARWEENLAARRGELEGLAKGSAASQTELARLTVELRRMEQTLADLKALRERQQQTYSLIPYRGKRGDNRKPIYVECTSTSLIFHPDRQTVALGPLFAPLGLKEEIERRLSARRGAVAAVDDKAARQEYILFLIRPSGITTYYKATALLQKLGVDFGYEFIDADWVLNFPDDDSANPNQPWMLAGAGVAASPQKGPIRKVTGIPPIGKGAATLQTTAVTEGGEQPVSGFPGGRQANPGLAAGLVGSPGGAFSDGRGGGGTGNTVTGIQPGQGTSGRGFGLNASSNGPGNPTGGPEASLAARAIGGLSLPRAISGSGSMTASPGTGATVAKQEPAGSLPGMPGSYGSGSGAAAGERGEIASPQSGASSQTLASQNQVPVLPEGAQLGSGGSGGGNHRQDSRQPPGAQTANATGAASASGAGPTESSGLLPALTPGRPGATGGSDASGQTDEHGQEGRRSRNQDDSGHAGDVRQTAPGDPLAAIGPANSQPKRPRTTGLRPTMLTGNRDWVIPIECTANALVILQTGQTIAAATLNQVESADNELLRSLQKLIARRQASVRPGDPPYRPMIRFRVHADALRTYYLAYPALEALGIPMTRENVAPDDDSRKEGSR